MSLLLDVQYSYWASFLFAKEEKEMLKQGMIERFKKAAPMIGELVDDLEWIQSEFNPEKATEEERTYAKHLLSLGSNLL